jgi:hypothetical protein
VPVFGGLLYISRWLEEPAEPEGSAATPGGLESKSA